MTLNRVTSVLLAIGLALTVVGTIYSDVVVKAVGIAITIISTAVLLVRSEYVD